MDENDQKNNDHSVKNDEKPQMLKEKKSRKKQKEHTKMLQALEKGTKVKTIGGVYGTVTGVKEDRFVLRIAENVKIEVAKEAVASKIE